MINAARAEDEMDISHEESWLKSSGWLGGAVSLATCC